MKPMKRNPLDIMDWGVRQLRVADEIDTRQMILVLEVMRQSLYRKRGFSDRELKIMCLKHRLIASAKPTLRGKK